MKLRDKYKLNHNKPDEHVDEHLWDYRVRKNVVSIQQRNHEEKH